MTALMLLRLLKIDLKKERNNVLQGVHQQELKTTKTKQLKNSVKRQTSFSVHYKQRCKHRGHFCNTFSALTFSNVMKGKIIMFNSHVITH